MEPKQRGKLLVVDDEPEIREIIEMNSTPLGVEVIEAGDGQAALEMVRLHRVDVIISDLMMPRMSGITLLGELRSAGFNQPFIFMTAFPGQDSTLQALRLGAFDYIEKPFEGDDLRTLLSEAMRVSHETQRLDAQMSGEIRKLRTLRYDSGKQLPVSAAASQQMLQDLFVSEATPQLLFCEASIKGLRQPDDRAFELGYLFRVMQGVASAAESIGAREVTELARAAERYYVSLRVQARSVDDRLIELAHDANRLLQLMVTTLGREGSPDVSETVSALRQASSELDDSAKRAG